MIFKVVSDLAGSMQFQHDYFINLKVFLFIVLLENFNLYD